MYLQTAPANKCHDTRAFVWLSNKQVTILWWVLRLWLKFQTEKYCLNSQRSISLEKKKKQDSRGLQLKWQRKAKPVKSIPLEKPNTANRFHVANGWVRILKQSVTLKYFIDK